MHMEHLYKFSQWKASKEEQTWELQFNMIHIKNQFLI